MPEHDPGHVEGALCTTQARHLDNGRHNHKDTEAKRQAQAQFLTWFNSYRPEQTHRYGDDQYVSQDVQADDGGGEDEWFAIVRVVPALSCDNRIS